MAKTKKAATTDTGTDVFVYLRKSHESDEAQAESIERQRAEVQAHCQRKNYRILHEYQDTASGSKNQERRTGFQQMMADIVKGTTATKIVCWNRSRFGRLDAFDSGLHVNICRSAGVMLDTVREGEFDWSDSAGRWKDYALSEAGKALSVSLSADSLSGRVETLKAGFWPNGAVPYGYDRQYVSNGQVVATVARSQPTARPQGSKLKLSVNEAEAIVVRRIFKEFANKDTSLPAIARELNTRKFPAPDTLQKKKQRGRTGNEGWNCDTLKAILKNAAYTGVGSIGHGRKRSKVAFNRATPTQIAGACPIIVDAETFNTVQAKLTKRSNDTRRVSANPSALSGFVFCGHCSFRTGKREQKGRVAHFCTSPGKRTHYGCKQWSVREDVLLPKVSAFLVEHIDGELLRLSEAKPPEQTDDRSLIEGLAVKLREKIDNGLDTVSDLPKELRADFGKKIQQWRDELTEVENRLALEDALRAGGALANFRDWWNGVKDRLIHLPAKRTTVTDDEAGWTESHQTQPPVYTDPATFRELLSRLGVKIVVFWEIEGFRHAVKDIQITVNATYANEDHTSTDSVNVFRLSFSKMMA